MQLISQSVGFAQFLLDAGDLSYESGLFLSDSARGHSDPAEIFVRDNRNRISRDRSLIVFSQPVEDQKDQLVSCGALLSHSRNIAGQTEFAKWKLS